MTFWFLVAYVPPVKHPILPDVEVAAIARRYRSSKNPRVLDPLVASCLGLVVFCAGKMAGVTGAPFDELYAEGCLGLWLAVQHFDPDRGRLASYAVLWIRAKMLLFVTGWRGVVHWVRSNDERSVFWRLSRVEYKLGDDDHEKLADAVGVPREVLDRAMGRMAARDVYFDDPSTSLQIASDAPSPEEVAIEHDELDRKRATVTKALGRLDQRERSIVEARHMTEKQQTLRAVAPTLGISYERVRQLEERAMRKLHRFIPAVAA